MTTTIPLTLAPDAPAELAALLRQAVGLAGELMSRSYVPMPGAVGAFDDGEGLCIPRGEFAGADRWTRAAAQALACLARRAAVGPHVIAERWKVDAKGSRRIWLDWKESPQHATLTIEWFGSEYAMPAAAVARTCADIRRTVEWHRKERTGRAALPTIVAGAKLGPPLPIEHWTKLEASMRRNVLPRAERWLAAVGVPATTT